MATEILKDKNVNNEKQQVNEIINDAFWLGFILELKRKVSNTAKKEVLSSFLIYFSSIFTCETLKSDYGGLSGKRNITSTQINDYRMNNLKYIHNMESKDTKKLITEMGIDFENYVFDLNLFVNNDNLIDTNFRNWNSNKEEYFELLDGIVATPFRWIEILLPGLFEEIEETLVDLIDKYLNNIDEFKLEKKPYASSKLFSGANINNNEKVYILQRYGLVKTIILLEKLMEESIVFNIGNMEINSNHFFIKIRAIIIELFWNDNKKHLPILNKIFQLNNVQIDKKFYALNRRIRDNIHYNWISDIKKEEYQVVSNYQHIYLKNVIKVFDEYINIKFDDMYERDYEFAKLIYELGEKNECN